MNDIFVFYHAFLKNNWEEIFDDHLCELIASELYSACQKIYVGVIFRRNADLARFEEKIYPYKKIVILYVRNFAEISAVWNTPPVVPEIQLGESETILKMVEFAQKHSPCNKYLFFHSKGVSNPPSLKRSTMNYFREKGFKGETNAEINQFIHEDMKKVISEWRRYVDLLETTSFSYYLWNFFWIKGDLLHAFQFDEFIEKQGVYYPADKQFYPLRDRHVFSLFPIKLQAICNEVVVYKQTNELIDCGPEVLKEQEEQGKAHFGSMYSEAIQCLHNGAIKKAREKCMEILAIWPDDANVMHLVGITYFEQKRYEEAISFINDAIKIKNDNPSYYYNLANIYNEKGETDRAISFYEISLKMNPNQAESLVNLGGIYGKQQNVEKSLQCFRGALQINPNNVQALVNLGLIYGKIGRYDDSIACYEKAKSKTRLAPLHDQIVRMLDEVVQKKNMQVSL